MKTLRWKFALLGIPAALAVALVMFVVPATGQDQPGGDKPPVGVDQAAQLSQTAVDAIKAGNYKDAIHALHSAAFILEEGLGMHAPCQGMMPPMMNQMGRGPMEMGPMGPPSGMERPPMEERFPAVMERTWGKVHELQNAGVDVGDIPDRLESAQKAFDEGRKDEAWEILRTVHRDLERIANESRNE